MIEKSIKEMSTEELENRYDELNVSYFKLTGKICDEINSKPRLLIPDSRAEDISKLKITLLPAVIQNLDYYLKSSYREAFESYFQFERMDSKFSSYFAVFVAEQMAIANFSYQSDYESEYFYEREDYYEENLKPIKDELKKRHFAK